MTYGTTIELVSFDGESKRRKGLFGGEEEGGEHEGGGTGFGPVHGCLVSPLGQQGLAVGNDARCVFVTSVQANSCSGNMQGHFQLNEKAALSLL